MVLRFYPHSTPLCLLRSVRVRQKPWVLGLGSFGSGLGFWVLGHLTQKTRPDPGPMTEGRFSLSASVTVTTLPHLAVPPPPLPGAVVVYGGRLSTEGPACL